MLLRDILNSASARCLLVAIAFLQQSRINSSRLRHATLSGDYPDRELMPRPVG